MLAVAALRPLPIFPRLPKVTWDPANKYLVLSASFSPYIMLLLILIEVHQCKK